MPPLRALVLLESELALIVIPADMIDSHNHLHGSLRGEVLLTSDRKILSSADMSAPFRVG